MQRKQSARRFAQLLLLCCCFATSLYFVQIYYFQIEQKQNADISPSAICAFGNAENIQSAISSANQFPSFKFWLAIWGESLSRPTTLNNRIHLIPAHTSTHADGWEITFKNAVNGGHNCSYYFFMDDDLTWQTSPLFSNSNVETVLLDFINLYKPAVTVFSWPWGDVNLANLTAITNSWSQVGTQPVSGFDNGCMIFHHSIVDFFIPIHLGGGFEPKFTVQHTFQNFLIPFLFQSNAIRFNGISYVNPPKVRHPYDNATDYKNFFFSGSRCGGFDWGCHLNEDKIWWKPEVGNPPYTINLFRLSIFFNLTHSTIFDHPYLRQRYSTDEIKYMDNFTVTNLPKELYCSQYAEPYLMNRVIQKGDSRLLAIVNRNKS